MLTRRRKRNFQPKKDRKRAEKAMKGAKKKRQTRPKSTQKSSLPHLIIKKCLSYRSSSKIIAPALNNYSKVINT